MYTTPPATAGEDAIGPPVVALHTAVQLPAVQLVEPSALNARRTPSFDPMYASWFAIVGEDTTGAPVVPVHRGVATPAVQLPLPAAPELVTFVSPAPM